MAQTVQLIRVAELPPGQCRPVMAGDLEVAVFNVDGQFYVLKNECPHAGGPLGEGFLEGPVVTCPWHGWQFDVTSGQAQGPASGGRPRQAQRLRCEVDGEWLKVEVP
ncbi:MAG: Rieske 2Fe-2S domain-containing protein [Planctomycetia bacterium]|nr:Rieske 2Fe-2S domain-containing protein [Planctomycetia bacterium]